MVTECFLLADSAHDYQGRLCIVGAFDTIMAQQAPHKHPHCGIAGRVRFERSEEGKHTFRVLLIDQDGKVAGPQIDGNFDLKVAPEAESAVMTIAVMMTNLVLQKFGTYHWDLVIDGSLRSRLPLYLRPAQQQRQAA